MYVSFHLFATPYSVVWSTKNSTKNQVCYGEYASSLGCVEAAVSTYTQDDMCGPPAKTIGWCDPGQIITATMTGLVKLVLLWLLRELFSPHNIISVHTIIYFLNCFTGILQLIGIASMETCEKT